MKKIFYFAMAALAGALLVSCEPTLIDGPDAKAPIGASELQSSFVIDGQFADAACTIPQADGNYIKYHTSPARTVQVYNTKADGPKNVLVTGVRHLHLLGHRRFAMIGVGEKSIVNIRFTARSAGGHASTPGKDTPLVKLGKFMAYLERHQIFEVQLSPTVAEMLKQFAPYMGKAGKVVGKADRLRYPLKKVLPKFGPAAASLLSTTIAFTMAGGGEAVNVIPHEAWVIGDMRCSHHQGRDKSLKAVLKAAKKFDLEAEVIDLGVESRLADYDGEACRLAAEAVMKTVPGVDACAPYIMTGASDARYFDRVCDQCIRFLPFPISTEQMASIHGVNECIDADTLVPAVDYYRYLLQHV